MSIQKDKENPFVEEIKNMTRYAEEGRWGKRLSWDMGEAAKKVSDEGGKRGIAFMSEYYGFGGEGKTLEHIGTTLAGGLTRERVRQIIDATKEKLEIAVARAGWGKTPYAKLREIYEKAAEKNAGKFAEMSDVEAHSYVKAFEGDKKGLSAILSDAEVRQVVYRGKSYLYPAGTERKTAVLAIQSKKKKERRAKTEAKMDGMAKSVTYVPVETREAMKSEAKKRKMPLNRLYEKVLRDFAEHARSSGKTSKDFPQTKSWRARQGKAEWSQVGLYIEKKVFDDTRAVAESIGVSNMSFVCQAFVWFTTKS